MGLALWKLLEYVDRKVLIVTSALFTGGNAKTLMFVNISPADYNTDETVTSLT